jgi:hypothetical protein
MRMFPRVFEYKGFTIKKTSFSFRVVELNEYTETYQEAKDLIDRHIIDSKHEKSKKMNATDDVETFLEAL